MAMTFNKNKALVVLIEQVVSEVISEAMPEPEAPPGAKDAWFGNYLFAPARADLPPEAKEEEDTKEEKEFYHNLDGHYGFGDYLENLDQILPIIKKGYYKKILSPPKGRVYRFLSGLNVEDASKILRLDPKEIVEAPKKGYWVTGGGTINPLNYSKRNSTQSWSTSMNPKWMAKTLDHAARPLSPARVAILLVADTTKGGNTFFMNPKGVKNIKGMAPEAYLENEVISYGPVEFEEAAFIKNDYPGEMGFKEYWKELMKALGEKTSIGEE